VHLFEIGKVFGRPPDGQQLPDEREMLGAILAGDDAIAAVDAWHVLADTLDVQRPRLEQVAVSGLHPTRSAEILASDQVVGAVGEIDPGVLERFGITERVGWLEVDLDRLLALPHAGRQYQTISRYPSSDIDLAFEVHESVPAAAIEGTIVDAAGPLLTSVRLFDVYRGTGLPDDHRSLAYRLRLQAPDRTLTDRDIAEVRDRVIEAVRGLGASLRG
jgi:phenylalanyl-tRNA synthetase beta chain